MSTDLNQRLLAAHADKDKKALVSLYLKASNRAPSEEAQYFYLTHAYVFALDTDHPQTASLHATLKAAGRES